MSTDKKTNDSPPMEARQYQLELLEYVIHNNAIIYLPTGAGKTYVAILALKRFSMNLDKPITEGGKRSFFMCNTVELARQQAIEIRKHTNLKVGLYLGERDVDNWDARKWKEEITENQVLVGTVQIFVNIVSGGYIKITDLSIVIIDECHHGTKLHPMHEFMRMFQHVEKQELLPRVVGLTGVLLKGNKLSNIVDSLRALEVTYRANIVTVSDREKFLNVLIHSTRPEEKLLQYGITNQLSSVNDDIASHINNCLKIISEFDLGNQPVKLSKGLVKVRESSKKSTVINLLNDIQYHLIEYGLYCTLFVVDSVVIELELKTRQAETSASRRMYRATVSSLEVIRHIIFKKVKETLDEENPTNEDCHKVDVIYNYSTPKLICLLRFLQSTFAQKKREDISCLIFVERRLTAKAICYVIQKFVNLTPSLQQTLFPEFIVGRNSMLASAIENVLDRKWNKKVMSDFRNGVCNMLVCSNVLEEGIDVQACNFVIAFDPLKTFNSYIQTKGRARTKGSTYAITTSKLNAPKVIETIKKYQEVHISIQNFLFNRTLQAPQPNQEEIDTEFDDKMKPLTTPKGACLMPSSALQMLNRYCQMLPWDAFGCLLPQFKKQPSNGKYGIVVSVKLPLQSQVKEEILSDGMENVKMAKISAALKTCKRLFEEGELNDSFLPISKTECVKIVSDMLFKHWEKFDDNVVSKNLGKSKVRLYDRRCPEQLYGAMPIVGDICYAYEIQFTPEFEFNEYNAHVFEALKTNSNFAILLSKRLPVLAAMPLFMRQGSLTVRISSQPLEFRINSEEQLQQLRKYHLMIMRDILQCWRSYYVQDGRNKENSFLVIPISAGVIDWITVQKFERLKPNLQPSISERQNCVYRAEEWLGKIVGKWYTSDTSERFLVTKVHTNQSPMTEFPDSKCQNYLEYFEKLYGRTIGRIINQNQFLIEVKSLTARRNFFNNAKSKDSVIKRDTQKIVLIPELCHNFEHPGDLWLKALFLPSILHRLHYLLHAEHLRQSINAYLGLSNQCIDYKPKPLIIDTSLRRAVDSDENTCMPKKESPVLMSPIESSCHEEVQFEVFDLMTDDNLWKAYLEPIDIGRQSKSIFPVELQYYHNFNKFFENSFKLLESPELEYSSNHLNMPKNFWENSDAVSRLIDNSIVPQTSALAINDVSIEEKLRIDILERSFSKKNHPDNSKVVSAEQRDFMAALTTSGANDVFDMERLELLGDAFLKFSIALYLVHKFPKWNEGFLTEVKSKLVSNRNLLYCLLETDIPSRICSGLLSIHEWLPPLVSLPSNFLEVFEKKPSIRAVMSARDLFDIELDESEVLSGRCNDKHISQFKNAYQAKDALTSDGLEVNFYNDLNFCTYKEARADKNVADTLEALLGVCVKSYGIHQTFRMLEYFGICRPQPGDKPLTSLLDLNLNGAHLRASISPSEVDAFIINYQYLENNLGYKFRDRAYLLQALTHPSYPTNRITGCYQELEFIGDAILDFLVSCYIFERNETMVPGMLTDLRSALVNNITLGCICVRHRFHLFILAENAVLAESIKKFADFQETQKHRVTDQVHILMEEDDKVKSVNCGEEHKANISVNVEVPKVLGDVVEALFAAVYLDSRSLETTWNVIFHLLKSEINEFSHKMPIDAVRQLYEHPSAKPHFSDPIVDKDTVMVKCSFSCLNKSVVVNGFGVNKRQAKKSAAKHALQILCKA